VLLLVLALGLVALIVWWETPRLEFAGDPDTPTRCASNLRTIGFAIEQYAARHGGQYPDCFETLVRSTTISPDAFVCPSSSDSPSSHQTPAAVAADLARGGHLSYIYVGRGLTTSAPADVVVAYEAAVHHGNYFLVLFTDGHAEAFVAKLLPRLTTEIAAGKFPVMMPQNAN
jgi:hypothetical protein